MRRGDLVTVVAPGNLGKPRPAVVVQADRFDATATVTVALVSSTPVDSPLLRLSVAPTAGNGLRRPSQVMVDKVVTLPRSRVGRAFGRLEDEAMLAVTRALAVFLGIA